MTNSVETSQSPDNLMSITDSKYNNYAICAAAIMAVLEEAQELSVAKSLLIMPIIMHDATVRFLGKSNVRGREVAALVATRPDLFLNFNSRFVSGLAPTLNAIQFLATARYVKFDGKLKFAAGLEFRSEIGARAQRVKKAAKNIAAILDSSDEEPYLNLRIEL